MVFLVFCGPYKIPVIHRPGYAIKIPLIVLAAFSIGAGYLKRPLLAYLESAVPPMLVGRSGFITETYSEVAAAFAFVIGLYFAYLFFLRKPALARDAVANPVGHAIHAWWFADWGFDWLYDKLFVQPVLWAARTGKRDFIDLVYTGLAGLSRILYRDLSMTESGHVRWYAAGIAGGNRCARRACVVFMILIWLVGILLVAGLVSWLVARWSENAARWIALAAVSIDFALGLFIWIRQEIEPSTGQWMEEVSWQWIPRFGIHFHFAMDGLSLLLAMLTFFLGFVSVLASWKEIHKGVGFFHLNLLWILAGIVAVFFAVDLFVFYFAWELMLVPMYFLIAIWGHERRVYASIKFFLFTQLSGLLMLISILALYFMHHTATGIYTFEYRELLGTPLSPRAELWIMLGFVAAFMVKLPVVPFHTWLPDAHTEAPTAGSVILAGLLLKTGAYGFIRFVIPLFPHAAREFTPVALILAVIGILYGAIMAFAQTDLKRLVAYTSVSHLGFVLLGIFVWSPLALQGAVMTMICHGLSTGALFVLVGSLQERIHTREMAEMGGLWDTAPRLSGAALFFALASLGLPGLGDFIGEFLVMLGSFRVNVGITVAAAIGVLAATFYALLMVQRAFHGSNVHHWHIPDLTPREGLIAAIMIAGLLWLGLCPQPVFNTFRPAMNYLQSEAILK